MLGKDIKRKRGRPLVDGAKRKQLATRYAADELASIERAARIKGISTAEFIRMSAYELSKEVIEAREQELRDRFGGENGVYSEEYYYDDTEDEDYLE